MLTILTKIFKFNELLVLGVMYRDDHVSYHVMHVRKKSNELQILRSFEFSDIDALINGIDKKKPILLVVNGKGILSRRIQRNNNNDTEWKKNLNYETLYFTEFRTSEFDFLSFCRRKLIDDIIVQLKSLQIIDFYIGPLLSVFLQPKLGLETLLSADTLLIFNGNEFYDLKKSHDENIQAYNIENKTISHQHLPLFGAAVHFFIRQENVRKNSSNDINKEEIYYKVAFNTLAIGMLILFFISLLASYCLIQYYTHKNIELNQHSIYSNQAYQQILKLEKEKEQKISLLNDTGQLTKHFLTYYAYEISTSAPKGIRLDKISVFPATEDFRANKRAVIDSNHISLVGTVVDDATFDDWLSNFESRDWIKKLEIIFVKKDKKSNFQKFELKIVLNNV